MTKLSDLIVELERKHEYYTAKAEEYGVIDKAFSLHCLAQADALHNVLEKLRWVTQL